MKRRLQRQQVDSTVGHDDKNALPMQGLHKPAMQEQLENKLKTQQQRSK